MKFAIFLKSSPVFNSFYCFFCLKIKLYGSIAYKLEQLWMRKFQCLILPLKRSFIYYIICITVPLLNYNIPSGHSDFVTMLEWHHPRFAMTLLIYCKWNTDDVNLRHQTDVIILRLDQSDFDIVMTLSQ